MFCHIILWFNIFEKVDDYDILLVAYEDEKENFYESSKEILDSLETKLQHNTEEELDKYRTEVSQMLSAEIVKRYYFSKGEAQEVLKNGEMIGIFPEGTRNRTQEELLKFRHGAVAIAQKANAGAYRGKYETPKRSPATIP